jgi:sn-glycerol 3-phosphate transport system permease protein
MTRSRRLRDVPLALAMLAPSLAIFGAFIFYPLARTVYLGLHQNDFFGGHQVWIGWKQYSDVLGSHEFRHSLWVTFQFALLTVPIGLVLGVVLAVLAHKAIRGIGFFRTVFSSTVATSVAVASLMWLVLLNPSVGVLTRILPIEALRTPGLLKRPGTALVAVAITTIWQNLGFAFIVMTAGLQSIPEDLYESASVEGASPWLQFSNITIPMLSPTLLFATVVLTIGAFQSFGQIDLLTDGGPGDKTRVIAYSIYGEKSPLNGNDGVQAATAVLLFVILVALSLFQFRALDKRVHYGG